MFVILVDRNVTHRTWSRSTVTVDGAGAPFEDVTAACDHVELLDALGCFDAKDSVFVIPEGAVPPLGTRFDAFSLASVGG